MNAALAFKRLLGSLGVGGPSVDTVLKPGAVRPGGTLRGQVNLQGGRADVNVERITLELVARVERDGGEREGCVAFDRFIVGGGFWLGEGQRHSEPFAITLPWETPITELYGQGLGIVLGVRTELAVAGARDKGDLDALAVTPLPVQEAILEAFGQLGFGFKTADLELGHIGGTGQQLPFYQEIELAASPEYAHAITELEVTFLAHRDEMEVVLEADKRGGLFSSGHDAVTRFRVPCDGAEHQDWNTVVDGWVRQMVEYRASYGHGDEYGHDFHGHGHDGHGHGHGSGSHGHGGHHRSGPGVGTAVAAGAAGLAVAQLRAEGHEIRAEDIARLSPLKHRNLNPLGRYSFRAPTPAGGTLRPPRDPTRPTWTRATMVARSKQHDGDQGAGHFSAFGAVSGAQRKEKRSMTLLRSVLWKAAIRQVSSVSRTRVKVVTFESSSAPGLSPV